ncbi:hypothetical protein JNUCC0626_08720 [Lentzea sp. JNUCC 0626]|uniref:hypothetical protein n=1 Tax=Lentzea sp. JNUCC 0626 TaxID=3367513 RepID=UPI00374A43DE
MIDQLPDHRPLPDDVRLRARRRLSEGMDPRARNGRPVVIAAGVALLAATTVFASQALLGSSAEIAGPPMQYNGEFVGKDRNVVNNVGKGPLGPDMMARCVAAATAHPPADQWSLIAVSHKNGTVLSAFRAPAGVFFCANTATTTTISAPDAAQLGEGRRQVKVLFTTPTGAMAGLVSPDVKFLSLTRIADSGWNTASPGLIDGLFLAPTGYVKAETGTKALVNGQESALRGVPGPSASVTDLPAPPADRSTPEAQQLAACMRDRAVPDADQFSHGVTVKVSATNTIVLGGFGNLMFYCLDDGTQRRGLVYDLRETDDMELVLGQYVGSVRASYDFVPVEGGGTASSSYAAVGILFDPEVASITYTAPGAADVPAVIGNGTFVLAAPFVENRPGAQVVVRNAQGVVMETITPKR